MKSLGFEELELGGDQESVFVLPMFEFKCIGSLICTSFCFYVFHEYHIFLVHHSLRRNTFCFADNLSNLARVIESNFDCV